MARAVALDRRQATLARDRGVTRGPAPGMGSINWAFLFDLLEFAQPGSFHLPELNATAGYEPYLRRYDPTNSIYFSFVTLTTLGFGEITPATVLARTLVWLEAVTGQLYLAVLVARLVSLQIIHSSAAAEDEARGPAPPAADAPE